MKSVWGFYGLLLAALLLGCAASGKKDTDRPSYSITMKVAEKLREVGEAAREQKWDSAIAKVNGILESDYINPYERAAALQARAGIHAAQQKFDEALPDMEQAVALDAMPIEQQRDATFNLAQNYFLLEKFSESADTFAKWDEMAEEQTGDQLYVIASAFAQAKRFKEAVPYATRAIEQMKPPTEAVLQFMASLHYELGQEKELAGVLEQLTKAFPNNKSHRLQLAATYTALGDDKKALETLDAAYAKKLLTEEKEILELSRLYMQAGRPDQCGTLLDKHMADGTVGKGQATYELQAGCLLAAKEVDRAAKVIAAAGDSLTNGEIYFELAKQQLARGQWIKARDAAAAAFAKGGLSSPAEAQLLLGVAHYYTKRKDAALGSLAEARKNPATSKCAEAWLQTVKSGKGTPQCLPVGNAPAVSDK
jgi:thioredoxin-like negative regulator of GroEL